MFPNPNLAPSEIPASPPEETTYADPLSVILPSFFQPRTAGSGFDRGILGAMLGTAVDYSMIGDILDAYELTRLGTAKPSELDVRGVAGTIGMMGVALLGGSPLNRLVANAMIESDPRFHLSEPSSVMTPITHTARVGEPMSLTSVGTLGEHAHGNALLPHQTLSRMGTSLAAGTIVGPYPGVDEEISLYEEWRAGQLADSPFTSLAAGEFRAQGPRDFYLSSMSRFAIGARLHQTWYGTAVWAPTVERLSDALVEADILRYARLTGAEPPALTDLQRETQAAILRQFIDGDMTGTSEHLVNVARNQAIRATEEEVMAAAKWANQKVRLSKMASAWDARMIGGDTGAEFDTLWHQWASGEMVLDSTEATNFVSYLTEMSRLVDLMPHTDATVGWSPTIRVVGFELNKHEPSQALVSLYQTPKTRQGLGVSAAPDEIIIGRDAKTVAADGTWKEHETAPVAGTLEMTPGRVRYAFLDPMTLVDPADPDRGSGTRLGDKHVIPAGLIHTDETAKAFEAEIYGNFVDLLDAVFGGSHLDYNPLVHTRAEMRAAGHAFALNELPIGGEARFDLDPSRILKRSPQLLARRTTKNLSTEDLLAMAQRNRDRVMRLATGNSKDLGHVTLHYDPETASYTMSDVDAELLALMDPINRKRLREAEVEGYEDVSKWMVPAVLDNADQLVIDDDTPEIARATTYTLTTGESVVDADLGINFMEGRAATYGAAYTTIYPTIINWVSARTGYSPLQISQVFGTYGQQTVLNLTNIPALVTHALGWTSVNSTGGIRRPLPSTELTGIIDSLERGRYDDNADLRRQVITKLEDWFNKWTEPARIYTENPDPDQTGSEWFDANYGMLDSVAATGEAILNADPRMRQQMVDLYGTYMRTISLAQEFHDMQAEAHRDNKPVTKFLGVSRTGQPGELAKVLGEPGAPADLLVEGGKREGKGKAKEAITAEPAFARWTNIPEISITYNPHSKTWSGAATVDGEKLRTYALEVGDVIPDLMHWAFSPSDIVTETYRVDNRDVTLQKAIDVVEAMASEPGLRLMNAVVADVHNAASALGFTSRPDIVSEQFSRQAAYNAITLGLMNLRMAYPDTPVTPDDADPDLAYRTPASALQAVLWYAWRHLATKSDTGIVFSRHTLHAMQGRTSDPGAASMLASTSTKHAYVRDFQLPVEHRQFASSVMRIGLDGTSATEFVPVSEVTRHSRKGWPLMSSPVTVRITGDRGQTLRTEQWVPVVRRAPRRVADTWGSLQQTHATTTESRLSRLARGSRVERAAYASYRGWDAWRAHTLRGTYDYGSLKDGTRGAFLQQFAKGVRAKRYTENALRWLWAPDRDGAWDKGKEKIPDEMIDQGREEVYRASQESLRRMGVPEYVIVWRQTIETPTEGFVRPEDATYLNTTLSRRIGTPENWEDRYDYESFHQQPYGPTSFSLVPPLEGQFQRAVPYMVKRSDILVDTLTFYEATGGWGYEPAENEVMVMWDKAVPVDPTIAFLPTRNAGVYTLGGKTSRASDRVASNRAPFTVELVVPDLGLDFADTKALAHSLARRIKTGTVLVDFETMEAAETERLVPTAAWDPPPTPVLNAAGQPAWDENSLMETWPMLQMMRDWHAATDPKTKERIRREIRDAMLIHYRQSGLLFSDPDVVEDVTYNPTKLTYDEDDQEWVEFDESSPFPSMGNLNYVEKLADAFAQLQSQVEAGEQVAQWETGPEAAKLDAMVGGALPKRRVAQKKMVVTFLVNGSVAAEDLMSLLHSEAATVMPAEYERRRPALPEPTEYVPLTDGEERHRRGHRIMDMFGENDPQLVINSEDPMDAPELWQRWLGGSGVHPDQLPVKAYRYQVFDGATTGSVLMGLADPTDPYITEVWIPASRQKRIAGSANTHISDPVGGISTSNLGGVTWGDGEVILEQGSIDYIIGLPEMLPEGLDPGDLVRRWVGFVPGEERSLRTARIFLQDRDGEVHMAKPSTIAMLIPDPEMSVKPWTNERLFVPPEADPPVSGPDARYDRPLVLLDEEEYMDYFRSVVPGLDEGRVVQVDLEWKGDRISKLIIFNNDPVTTGLAEWELLRTGVPHKYITKRTLEADPDRNLSEDEDAA